MLVLFLTTLYLMALPTIGMPWSEERSPPQPFFEQTPASVVVRPGQTVQIPCRVRNLGDKIVSWIRRRDLHIIASAGFMFTADPRFAVLHPEGDSAAWTLQLRAAHVDDQGLYECQVNTDPKMKQAVLLTVTDAMSDDAMELSMGDDASAVGMARVQGPREQYVRAGSTWTLTCEISGLSSVKLPPPPSTNPHDKQPRLVDWLREGQLLTFQSSRGGVSIDTEHGEGTTVSRLTLANLSHQDTGRYVCKPFSLPPAVVTIIVIDGEKTAMLGRDSKASTQATSSWLFLLLVIYSCTKQYY